MALALGARRPALAAVASALAAVALAIAVAGRSCRAEPPGPVETVRDFLHAARSGDRDTVYELLSPATHANLEAQAARATDYVGATMRYQAKDLVSLGKPDGAPAPEAIALVEERGERAKVLVVSATGDRSYLELVRVGGFWRIDVSAYGAPAQ